MMERHTPDAMTPVTNLPTQARRGFDYPADRICATAGCGTTLSIYNTHDLCSIHDQPAATPLPSRYVGGSGAPDVRRWSRKRGRLGLLDPAPSLIG